MCCVDKFTLQTIEHTIKSGLINSEISNFVHNINIRNANDEKFEIDATSMLIAFYAVGVEKAIQRECESESESETDQERKSVPKVKCAHPIKLKRNGLASEEMVKIISESENFE